ncbi:MAG: hypothetical protein L6R43_14145, partial [Planctomycetes bacterium]|nr:hypothetical protein [Planctomycetota bacterium]
RTSVRHVIVMSDGETSPFGLRRAVEGIVAAGGTISTVGIGADYDARLLGSLSDWGGGRTFPAVDPATLPEIVTLDTRRVQAAGREAAKKGERDPDLDPPPGTGPPKPPEKTPEKPLPPPAPPAKAALLPADPCAVLEGLAPFAPAVPPEAPPAARQATTVALRFEGDRGPALVLGRHGLGRTGVLAADPADLAASEEFPAAAARILRSLAPAAAGAGVSLVSVEAEAAGTRVRFEVRADGVAPIPRVELLDAAGDGPAPAAVERAGARRFEVVLPAEAAAYRTLVVRTGEGDGGTPLGFFDPGPAAARAADPDLPRRVAAAAGAVFVEGELPPPPPAGPGAPVPVPAGVWVAVAGAILLLADAILRRAGMG